MKTANIIGFAGSVLLFLLISLWMPVIGLFFSLIMPLPFLFYMTKLGLKEGLKTGVIVLLIVWLIGRWIGQPYLILFCLEFGIAGLIISELFKRNLSIGATIFWGTTFMLFLGAVFLIFSGISRGQGPVDMILGYLQSNIAATLEIYEETGLEQEKIEQIRQVLDLLGKLIVRIYPALIIIGTGLVVWINVILSRPLFLAAKMSYPEFGAADRWCSPEFMVWGAIGAGFALFLPHTGIKFIAENLLVVLSAIYVFHGLSIMMFFLNKYSVPGWAKAGIYILIVLQQIFLVLLAIIGLFDQWADFRRLQRETGSKPAS